MIKFQNIDPREQTEIWAKVKNEAIGIKILRKWSKEMQAYSVKIQKNEEKINFMKLK